MSDPRISEDFVIGHAVLVNEVEDHRELYNDQLKTVWADYREELKQLGLTGKEIAAEVAALKSAIAESRMSSEDRAKADEKAEGKDSYLAILTSPRARARVREVHSEPLLTKAAGQAARADASASLGTSSVENEAAEISTPITEPQAAPQPESDLTSLPSPQGQVAAIQPETANEKAGDVFVAVKGANARLADAVGVEPSPAALSDHTSKSTAVHTDAGNTGVTAGETAPITYPAPGVVTMEHTPPEGIVAHPFAAVWPVNNVDVSEGVREPIVKIGKLILDGRGRYFAARAECIEYPVVQYDGTDPLMDSIRWNLASRPALHPHNLKNIAHKLAKLEPGRADEIWAAFGIQTEEAA